MPRTPIHIRLMRADDFEAVVRIDEKVLKTSRREYYETKFEKLFASNDYIPTSLVAESEDGTLIGFVMGELFIGEYGITQEGAALDTIGVDPDFQKKGVGERLINEFMEHLKNLDVKKVSTLVGEDDTKLMNFFKANRFVPSKTINIEREL